MTVKVIKSRDEQQKKSSMLHDIGLRVIKVINLVLVTVPFVLCWLSYYDEHTVMRMTHGQSTGVVLMFAILYFCFGRIYDAFLVSLKRISEMFQSQMLGIVMADSFMFLVLCLLCGRFPNIFPALAALTGQLLLSAGWCFFAHHWYFARYAGKQTAIIYDVRRDMEGLFGRYGLDKKFDIRFTCNVEDCLAQRMQMLDGLDAVFLCGVHSHDRNTILKYCVSKDIVVYVLPRIGDVLMSGAKRTHMFHLPVLRAERYNPPIEYRMMKRAFDIVSSLMMILVMCPVMLAVAIAIKAHDGGPVLYKQTRLTQNGKQFKLLKFRSMRIDAEKDGIARLSTGENDDRVTPVGKVIRAYRLDELPQLFNILSGSMSVVGPRPERPEIAAQYEKEIPEFALRLQAKAGLTGYAQVYGKYNTEPYDKLQMDLMYIAKPSFVEDMRIIFATIQVLFEGESTEGIATKQMTAMGYVREDYVEYEGEAVGK